MNWEAVKTAYLTGQKSYRELAKDYGVNPATVAKRGRKESWPAQREAYRQSVAKAVTRRKRAGDADKLLKLMDAADALSVEIADIAQDVRQRHTRYETILSKNEETGRLEAIASEYVVSQADTRSLNDLTRALESLTRTMRNLYGLPTQQEKHAQRMEERRTRMMEQRAGTLEPEDTGVVIMPEAVEHPDEETVEVEQ